MYTSLNESHGILTNKNIAYDELVKLIIEYIYDAEDGLNNYMNLTNDDNIANITITLSIIKSYYKFKYHKLFNEKIIPSWIGAFKIQFEEINKLIYGAKYLNNGVYNEQTDKLDFTVVIVDYINIPKEKMQLSIVHEMRHAYTDYLNKKKQLSIKKDISLYKVGTNAASKYPLVKKYGIDYIVLDNNVYNNYYIAEAAIFKALYYLVPNEISAFLQEYEATIKMLILLNKFVILLDLSTAESNKKRIKELSRTQIYDTNFLNTISITPYSVSCFRLYKALYDFWLHANSLDIDIAEEIVNKNIEIFRKILKNRNITNMDARHIITIIRKNYLKILEKILNKFYVIYSDILIYVLEHPQVLHNNIDKFINNNIINNNDNFEETILSLLQDIKIHR